MAIIKCVECGKDISDKASVCIGCGAPTSISKPLQNSPPNSDENLAANAMIDLPVNSSSQAAQLDQVENVFPKSKTKPQVTVWSRFVRHIELLSQTEKIYYSVLTIAAVGILGSSLQSTNSSSQNSQSETSPTARSAKSTALLGNINEFKKTNEWESLSEKDKQLLESTISAETCLLDKEASGSKELLVQYGICLSQSHLHGVNVFGRLLASGKAYDLDELMSNNSLVGKRVLFMGAGLVANSQLIMRKDERSISAIYTDTSALSADQKKHLFGQCSNLISSCRVAVIGDVKSVTPIASIDAVDVIFPSDLEEALTTPNEIARIRALAKLEPLMVEKFKM